MGQKFYISFLFFGAKQTREKRRWYAREHTTERIKRKASCESGRLNQNKFRA
jgi:hypothetical protein